MKKIFIICFSLFASFLLFACTNKSNKYKVTFETNGGTKIEEKYVDKNTKLENINSPKKEGYSFLYWAIDEELKERFYFDQEITSNITLYARYILNPENKEVYLVTFHSNCDTLVDNQYVLEKERIIEPTKLIKTGYVFEYWTTDENLENKFDFNKAVTYNYNLYAKWKDESEINMIDYKKEKIDELNNYLSSSYAYQNEIKINEILEKYEEEINNSTKPSLVDGIVLNAIKELSNIKNIFDEPSYGIEGDIIQPWLTANYSILQFENHFKKLKEAYINTVILQWSYDTTDNGTIFYDSKKFDVGTKYPYMLNNLLCAAERQGIRVYVGLNLDDAWWDMNNAKDGTWQQTQANIGVEQAQEIYSLYKTKYPNALYGWYFAYEFYCVKPSGFSFLGIDWQKYNLNWCNMLNIYLDNLTLLDQNMPLMLSPYYSSYYGGNYEETYNQWKHFFENTRFRKNDIMAPQDSFGLFGETIKDGNLKKSIEDYIRAFSEAAKVNSNISFWVNIEMFGTDYIKAPIEKVKYQMEFAKKYTKNLIAFSYTHYYLDEPYNKNYIDYLKTLNS